MISVFTILDPTQNNRKVSDFYFVTVVMFVKIIVSGFHYSAYLILINGLDMNTIKGP